MLIAWLPGKFRSITINLFALFVNINCRIYILRGINLIVIFLPLLLAACQYSLGNGSNQTTFINEHYFDGFDSVAIAKDRNEINFNSGQSANNCTLYLKEVKLSAIVESVNDQIIHTEYLNCEVCDLIKGTKIIRQKFKGNYGSLLSSKLDLTSFRSSLNRRARTNGPALQNLGERFLNTDASSVTYESEEWFYRLDLVAITDINQDGVQDWIVLLEDKSKVGNYHAGSTLIILNTDDSLLKAIPYSLFINDTDYQQKDSG